MSPVDFLIITPMPEEKDALLGYLPDAGPPRSSRDHVWTYYEAPVQATLSDGSSITYSVVVTMPNDIGRVDAANIATAMIEEFHPRYVLLIGIAGGIAESGVKLGDILIADQIADYEIQSVQERKTARRWRVYHVDARLLNFTINFSRIDQPESTKIRRPIPGEPKIHLGTIYSGDKIIARKSFFNKSKKEFPRSIGVEMEAGGVVKAALHAPGRPGFFMIRCASDLADANKYASATEAWRPYACEIAAWYTIELLKHGPVPKTDVEPPEPETRQAAVYPTTLHGADMFFGCDKELKEIDKAWDRKSTHILVIAAWCGVGKTSLVAKWMAMKAASGWPGFERVMDWSFYTGLQPHTPRPWQTILESWVGASIGNLLCPPYYIPEIRGRSVDSTETFLFEALKFFGDEDMANSPASRVEKANRLGVLVSEQRALLVLDGLESLQHPPGRNKGEIKDRAMADLLKMLAQNNKGLCIVTTREGVADLNHWMSDTVVYLGGKQDGDYYPQLSALSEPAGVELLRFLDVRGESSGLEQLVRDVHGHPLTLNLLGGYLACVHNGDIRKRHDVKLETANPHFRNGFAFQAMSAYEHWMNEQGDTGARQLAIMRLSGLFDRPIDADHFNIFRKSPVITGLTESIIDIDENDWNRSLSELHSLRLLSFSEDSVYEPASQSLSPATKAKIYVHPLVREHFASALRNQRPKAWRAAHQRLVEHLKDIAPE